MNFAAAASSTAIGLASHAGQVSPAHAILTNGARGFLGLGQLDLAQALADLALAEDEQSADALSVIAYVRDRQGDWQNSLAYLRRACACAPQAPQVHLNLGLALLRLGEYHAGFALYEARIEKPTWGGFATPESRAALRDRMLVPGQQVEGRRILVLAEQGLGDGIMFSRYITMLVKRGARVAVACNPTLRPFFQRIAGIETLLSPPANQPFAQINLAAVPFDAWVPLLSLALWFGTDATSVPADGPYWFPDGARVAEWRRRLIGAGRPGAAKVGLVFQANPAGAGHRDRSMTVDDVQALLALDGIDIVNLQHGPAGRALAKVGAGIIDPLPAEVPLDEYAAAVAATDLVISVDTMAIHCAGAMGHHAWLAVPHSPHWNWGLDGATTPWYRSLKIFRQAMPRDWSSVIAMLTSQLRERFARPVVAAGAPGAATPANGDRHDRLVPQAPAKEARADDRQAARRLSMIAQALIGIERVDLARPVAELIARLDTACSHDLMGDILEQGGNRAAAFEHRRKAAAGGAAQHRFNLGCAQLLRGEFKAGFANHEARRALPVWIDQALPVPGSLVALQGRSLKPGDPVSGRQIVVFTEQGLGDTFFAVRFLSMLAARGARITLVCRAPMRPFFARLAFLDAICSPPDDQPSSKLNLNATAFDAFCPLLSLPYVLGITHAADAPKPPYIGVDPAQTAAWRARFLREGRAGHPKVGVVWQANPSNRSSSQRSIPLQDLTPLARVVGADWVNLQDGAAGRGLAAVLPNVIDATREALPLDAFAAALAATDVLLTVDTMAAHCMGALGRPVWVALPCAAGWYWGPRRTRCGWYPTARLFRRGVGQRWSNVIEAMAAELADGGVPAAWANVRHRDERDTQSTLIRQP